MSKTKDYLIDQLNMGVRPKAVVVDSAGREGVVLCVHTYPEGVVVASVRFPNQTSWVRIENLKVVALLP